MNHKISFTTALIALGIISSASAATTNEVHITGSTAFRGTFFTAATAATGGIFDAPGGVVQGPGTNGSGLITYTGKIGGTNYALECSWTGSEAGIANVDSVFTLNNPGLPNGGSGAANLPGATTTFPKIDGTAGGFTGAGDLTMADTSQDVSLTKPPAHNLLNDYGVVGIVPFTWVKGKNSGPDASWSHLVNVTQPQMLFALGSQVNASFITGTSTDGDLLYMIGRNAGSGTRVNTLLDTQYGVGNHIAQFALNSTYVSGVLTYANAATTALKYPNVSVSNGSHSFAGTPNLVTVANDGFESGGGVANCLSCDLTGSGLITIGYLGISDAKACRDGVPTASPAQPSGAVWLTLDGNAENDAVIVNGTYSFWGHEHVLGQPTPSDDANIVAAAIMTGIPGAGNLGTGSAATQSSGVDFGSMLADKSGDAGYPAPF